MAQKGYLEILDMGVSKEGRNTYYAFKVQARGDTKVNDIEVNYLYTYSLNPSHTIWAPSQSVHYDWLQSPDYRMIHVACIPPAGWYCDSAHVRAVTGDGRTYQLDNLTDGNKP